VGHSEPYQGELDLLRREWHHRPDREAESRDDNEGWALQ